MQARQLDDAIFYVLEHARTLGGAMFDEQMLLWGYEVIDPDEEDRGDTVNPPRDAGDPEPLNELRW